MVTMPPEIQGHLDCIEALEQEYEKGEGYLADARNDLEETKKQSQQNIEKLGAQDAEHILRGGPMPKKSLIDAVQDEKDIILRLEIRVQGLETHLCQLSSNILAAQQQLSSATETWIAGECNKRKARILEITRKWVQDIAPDLAACRALGDPTTDAMQREIVLTSLGTGRDLAQPINSHGWRHNPAMAEIANEYSQIVMKCRRAIRRNAGLGARRKDHSE